MDSIIDILQLADSYAAELPPVPPLAAIPQGSDIATWIDHTLLKPEATASQIKDLCQEARDYHFASVCVNPAYASLVSGLLAGSSSVTCCVVGFPLGASLPTYKVIETLAALEAGAKEIDMVINIGALKGGALGQVLNEITGVVQVAHNQRAQVKVIIETALLTQKEKIVACLLCKAAGADFVKTSTGFASAGATVEDVALMRRVVGAEMGVKAAGGIRTYADALAMIRAGATRLGASAGVTIVREALKG